MNNHYYDEDGFYTYSLPANEGSEPPNNAVRIDLPEPEDYKKARLVDGAWVMTPCYEGVTYWNMDGTNETIKDNHTLPPEDVLFEPPPDYRYTTHDGSEWIFDLTGERNRLINKVISYCLTRDQIPFEFPADSGDFYAKSSAIINTIQMCEMTDARVTDPIPVNDGRWSVWDGAYSRPFTLGQLKALYLAGYEIGAHNYSVQETHRAAINNLTAPEQFTNYDVTSGGWK